MPTQPFSQKLDRSLAEAIGGRDLTIVPASTLYVARPVQRIQHASGIVGGLLRDRLDQVGRGFFMGGLGADRVPPTSFMANSISRRGLCRQT